MMENAITQEMIYGVNEELENVNSIFRIKQNARDSYCIELKPNDFVDNELLGQVYPNQKFYDFIEDVFKRWGVYSLSYNNTRTAFWAFK